MNTQMQQPPQQQQIAQQQQPQQHGSSSATQGANQANTLNNQIGEYLGRIRGLVVPLKESLSVSVKRSLFFAVFGINLLSFLIQNLMKITAQTVNYNSHIDSGLYV